MPAVLTSLICESGNESVYPTGYRKELLQLILPSTVFKPVFSPTFSSISSSPCAIFYSQVCVSLGGHGTPMAQKAPLDQQGSGAPTELASVCCPPAQTAPPAELKRWATGPGGSPGLRRQPSPQRSGQPVATWRPDCLRDEGELP